MINARKLSLKKSICAFENPYPKDDIIGSYADFLKHREYLMYYQFNPTVLENLLDICNDLWASEKRISRLSLIENIKIYLPAKDKIGANGISQNNKKLTLKIRLKLFTVFRKVFIESEYLTRKQQEIARQLVNNLLMNVSLTATEEVWFCNHIALSDHILNRVLRYPVKSAIISEWARTNFENNIYRNRRAELLSWLIDENPKFEIENQTLIDDFNYFNAVDKKAVKLYKDELEANEAIGREFAEFLPKLETDNDPIFGESTFGNGEVDLTVPELKLTRRFYEPASRPNSLHVELPSFEMMHYNFYSKIEIIKCITMIWGIGYSRLNHALKTNLIKTYLREETYNSIVKVATKNKNVIMLKWLMEQQ